MLGSQEVFLFVQVIQEIEISMDLGVETEVDVLKEDSDALV